MDMKKLNLVKGLAETFKAQTVTQRPLNNTKNLCKAFLTDYINIVRLIKSAQNIRGGNTK